LKISLQKVTDIEKCLILTLTGHIDAYNSNFFLKCVSKAIEEGFTKLIFQCSGLDYVSSSVNVSFRALLKTVKPKGGDFVLIDLKPKVYESFQLLGFLQSLNIRDNINDSIAFFRVEAPSREPLVFPIAVSCPLCQKKLRATKTGRFRCSDCKRILVINETGQVMPG